MGYFRNQLAALVMAVFAGVLSLLWVYFNGFAPVLDFVFLMAVPISWFLVVVLWLAQKSTDHMHKYYGGTHQDRKVSSIAHLEGADDADSPAPSPEDSPRAADSLSENKVAETRAKLIGELDDLKRNAQIKDEEIAHLKAKIDNLETQVQIESIKVDMANLKELASQR